MATDDILGLLGEINSEAQEAPLSLSEKVLGYSRSYLSGPTFNFADNIEAAIASPFTDLTYDQELANIRAQQDRFKRNTDYLDNAVEIGSGLVLNPISKIKALVSASTAAKSIPLATLLTSVLGSAPGQAALAGAGAANGKDVLETAGASAVLGTGLSAAGSVIGKVFQDTARNADRLKLSAYGIGAADIAKQLRKLGDNAENLGSASNIPLVKTLQSAEQSGIVSASNDLLENAKNIRSVQTELSKKLSGLLSEADEVVPANPNFEWNNTLDYINGLSGTAKIQAENAALEEITALTSQLGKGTLKDLQKAKVGLNYKLDNQNMYREDVITSLRSDLRAEIENRVNRAVKGGKLDETKLNQVEWTNRKWGDLQELKDVFVKKGYKDLGGDVFEDIAKGGATTGGSGTANMASVISGNPVYAAMGALLNAARVPESKSAVADVIRDPAISKTLEAIGRVLPELVTGRSASQAYLGTKNTQPVNNNVSINDLLSEIESLSANSSSPAQVLSGSESNVLLPQRGGRSPKSLKQQVSLFNNTLDFNANQTGENMEVNQSKVAEIDNGAFINRVSQVANNLETKPELLMAVMNFESAGTFSPSVKNPGSSATGLIQFTSDTAKSLVGSKTGKEALAHLASMTATEQLDFVEKHLKPYKGKLDTLDDVYMAVLYPKAVGKDSDYALFKKGTEEYWKNRGLDINDDGVITKAEATKKVEQFNV